MPRPCKMRRVASPPFVRDFKPCGIPRFALREVYLAVEGLEAMRLADLDGLDQTEAAARMGVSRQTLGRILASARRTVTRALVEGLALRIETGPGTLLETEPTPDMETPMKIAITVVGTSLDAPVDPRFGRAAGFLIITPETGDVVHLANGASGAEQGAGIAAVEIIAKAGARILLTGAVGPKAFQALAAAGIKVYQNLDRGTAREVLEIYTSGRAEETSSPMGGGSRG